MSNKPPIILDYVYPPPPDSGHKAIPGRSRWCAYRAGSSVPAQYGWGQTPAEAIADLLALEELGERVS